MSEQIKLLLVGCGKMGGALLRRTLAAGLIAKAVVIEPTTTAPDFVRHSPTVKWLNSHDQLEPTFKPNLILFAVKPQQMPTVLPAYARLYSAVFVSIAAGITIAKLQDLLGGQKTPIVRAMPNLPASIGVGMTVSATNEHVTPEQRDLCEKLFNAVGDSAWVEDEKLLDAVTALSGSGPAYAFALCEAMTKAGVVLGLKPALAARLARQTIIGSGALMSDSKESVEALRQAVTSPGGTTEAALKILLGDNGLMFLMRSTMTAAAMRSKELAGRFLR